MRLFVCIALVCALFPLQGYAEVAAHPGAEKALARIVLDENFGDDLEFHSKEVVTMAENSRVPGLNGLMFVRWKGADPATEITASVQWFEKTKDLMPFYRTERTRLGRGLLPIGDSVIWKTGENSYLWTDGAHFIVGLSGRPAPPRKMLEAWLALVESHPPDLAPVPTAAP